MQLLCKIKRFLHLWGAQQVSIWSDHLHHTVLDVSTGWCKYAFKWIFATVLKSTQPLTNKTRPCKLPYMTCGHHLFLFVFYYCVCILVNPTHIHWPAAPLAVGIPLTPWPPAQGLDCVRSNSEHEACPELFHAKRLPSCTGTAVTHAAAWPAEMMKHAERERSHEHTDMKYNGFKHTRGVCCFLYYILLLFLLVASKL